MNRLDEIPALHPALNPRAKLIKADIDARFESAAPHEIESASLYGLHESLGMMCLVFFELRPSRDRTVAAALNIDFFPMSVNYIKRLTFTESEQEACVEIISGLLVQIAKDLDRKLSELKSELVAAYILAAALRNVRDRKRALDGIQQTIVAGDELYTSLDKDATLPAILYEVQHRFASWNPE